jgi:hypothetical protein
MGVDGGTLVVKYRQALKGEQIAAVNAIWCRRRPMFSNGQRDLMNIREFQ